MWEGLEDKLKCVEFSSGVSKIYVPDTNILIDEYFSPIILSGNHLPDPEMNSRLIDLIRKTKKQQDNSPNDVIIYEIIEKELDNLRHNPKRQDIDHEVRSAMKLLLDLKKTGDLHYINPEYTYSVLENKARVHFISHDERHFQDLGLFDANNDDRIIRFIYELQNSPKIKDADKRVIFISNDINATDRAIKLGIEVQPFDFISVSDPNQPYSGITRLEMSQRRYDGMFKEKSDIETPRSIKKKMHPKNNQFLEVSSGYEKRLCMFVKDGKYIRRLKNYERFMEF